MVLQRVGEGGLLHLVLAVLLVLCAAPALAMSLAANYEPIDRSEFVAGLLTVGLKKVSETQLETPAGYRLNLDAASDFRMLRAWLAHGAFNGAFCSEQQAFHITTFDDPSEETMSRWRSLIVKDKSSFTVAFERIGNLGLWIYRDLPLPPERVLGRQLCTP